MRLGRFAGPIFTAILIVDCFWLMFLEWLVPKEDIDYVDVQWDDRRFQKVMVLIAPHSPGVYIISRAADLTNSRTYEHYSVQ